MKLVPFLAFVVWSTSVDFCTAAAAKHIVLSLADDLGYYDVGWKNPRIHSPVLKGLAENGIQLDRMYMYRFCSPSRSMLLTGKYPHRIGQQTDLNMNPADMIQCALQEEHTLLANVLKDAGYATHMFGKWHLGQHSEKYTPTARGFDSYVGFLSGATDHMTEQTATSEGRIFSSNKCSCATRNTYKSNALSCRKRKFCTYTRQIVNGTAQDGLRIANQDLLDTYDYADSLFADEAVRVIENHDPSEKLFLFLSWITPHAPTQSPESYMEQNTGMAETLNLLNCYDALRYKYAGMISALDAQHDKVIQALEAKDMWKDTLFIFLSDNGGHDEGAKPWKSSTCANSGTRLVKSGRNYPLRGGKFSFWEGGIRSIGFFYSASTDVIPLSRRGTVYPGLVSAVDLPNTILSAAGVSVPTGFSPDGVDQWSALTTGAAQPRTDIPMQIFGDYKRYVFLHQQDGVIYKYMEGYPGYIRGWGWGRSDRSIRSRASEDEVTIPEELDPSDPAYDSYVIANKGLTFTCMAKACLFDITNDPSETVNLVDDTSKAGVLATIRSKLDAAKGTEVPFVGSNLCYKESLRKQRLMQTRWISDSHAIAMAKICGAFVPYETNDGARLPLSPASCPAEVHATVPQEEATSPCTSLTGELSLTSSKLTCRKVLAGTDSCAFVSNQCVDPFLCGEITKITNVRLRKRFCRRQSAVCSYRGTKCEYKV